MICMNKRKSSVSAALFAEVAVVFAVLAKSYADLSGGII